MKKLILTIILLMLILLSGCSKNNIKFKVAYEGKGGFGFDKENSTFCISEHVSSKEQLIELSDKMNNHFFDESSTNYNNEIATHIRTYDDIFFKENSLIICVINAGNGYEYKINDLDIQDNNLSVNIKKIEKSGIYTDEGFTYIFVIETSKSNMINIEMVKVKII